MRGFCRFFCVLTLSACFAATGARAAGFALQETSVRHQGVSYAGGAANPADAATTYYNPAGMTALDGAQGAAGVSLILPSAQYTDTGSTGGLNAGAQAPYAGNNGSNPYPAKGIPYFYAAAPVGESGLWAGLSVTVPFGLANTYEPGWSGRYDSTHSALEVFDVAPVVAYRVNDMISIGGGPDIQYASARLDSALPCPGGAVGCGAAFTPATDGESTLKGDSVALGWNAGVMLTPDEKTRIGLHYRAAVTHTMTGRVTVNGLAGGLAGLNGVRDATADLNLPASAEVAVARHVGERLTLLGSFIWTGWSSFNEIRVKYAAALPDSVTPENYRNVWALAGGAEWKQTDTLTLRAGAQYDRTPTVTGSRTTRTPDNDRLWLSLGASYALNGMFTLDAAATQILIRPTSIDVATPFYAGGAATTVNTHGVFKSGVSILSLQGTLRF